MSDDWAKRAREQAKRAIKDMNAARNFPDGTCPASRHVAMMAETLAKGKKYHMLDSDREHCATSMAQTVKALWECRAKLAKAVRALKFIGCDDSPEGKHARATLAELTGGKYE